MGILSWWRKKESPEAKVKGTTAAKPAGGNSVSEGEVPGMNGAEEVRRPAEATVFEFGSSAGVTVAGYCPVSDELEPCRWEILPSTPADAPQFRDIRVRRTLSQPWFAERLLPLQGHRQSSWPNVNHVKRITLCLKSFCNVIAVCN